MSKSYLRVLQKLAKSWSRANLKLQQREKGKPQFATQTHLCNRTVKGKKYEVESWVLNPF